MKPERLAGVWQDLLQNKQLLGRILEDTVERFYRGWLSQGSVVIDVGANVGRHTIPLAQAVGEFGTVIAFEAAPVMFDKLNQRLKAMPEGRRISLRHAAVSDRFGTAEFSFVATEPALSSLRLKSDVVASRTDIERVSVPMTTLDDNCSNESVVFVKIDVEGAEFSVFRGARQLMQTSRPVFAFEDGRHGSGVTFGYELSDFYGFFEKQKYIVLDTLGFPVGVEMAKYAGPWNFFASPVELQVDVSERILSAALSSIFSSM